jgi:hypothetical protein
MSLTALGWHPLCFAESQRREEEEKAAAELSKEKQTKDEESPAFVLAEEARKKTDARKRKAKDEARTKKAEVEEEARFLLKAAAAKKEEDVLAKNQAEQELRSKLEAARKKEEDDFRETVKYVRALFAYDAAAEVELDLKEGSTKNCNGYKKHSRCLTMLLLLTILKLPYTLEFVSSSFSCVLLRLPLMTQRHWHFTLVAMSCNSL